MAAIIDNLWPQDIQLEVLSPRFILMSQVQGIREMTKGILDAEVTTVTGDKGFVTHRLDLIPTQLDGSRHRVLSATHRESLYPVVVEAEVYWPKPKTVTVTRDPIASLNPFAPVTYETLRDPIPDRWPQPGDWRPVASTQDEFIDRVREVLRSKPVRALVESLLARSYERALERQGGQPSDKPLAGE